MMREIISELGGPWFFAAASVLGAAAMAFLILFLSVGGEILIEMARP